MIMIVLILFACVAVICYAFIKGIQKLYSHLKASKEDLTPNPYIEAHKLRHENDKNYEDYLSWLNEQGGDIPIKKVLTREEWEFEKKLKSING